MARPASAVAKPRRGVALPWARSAQPGGGRTAIKPAPGLARAAPAQWMTRAEALGRPSGGNRSLVCYHHSASASQPAVLGQYLVFQLTNNHLLFPFETILLQCMSPEVMLWTAPPPARECHRAGGAA